LVVLTTKEFVSLSLSFVEIRFILLNFFIGLT
jgi:hypothetical protein